MTRNHTLTPWRVEDSADLYGIHSWGAGYFDVNAAGEVVICPKGPSGPRVPIPEIIAGIRERGYELPCLLRVENILDSQIAKLHESFRKAIKSLGYKGSYRGVFPIKVNQQQQVVEEIAQFGSRYHHGFEVGSKGELIAAVSLLHDREACLVCNGYKDGEFIDLGLQAQRLGLNVLFVLEMPGELEVILERARVLGMRPKLGVRCKLSTKASGHWAESGGERSVFGLTPSQIVDVVDKLKEIGMLDCLRLLHYHLGSQISNIRDIRLGAMEGVRFYVGLVQEGAPMGYLDLGGGLAVDYDGSHTNYFTSRNYTVDEYTADIVEAIQSTLDEEGIAHPHIVTESGRATVAYYSMLLVNILDVSRLEEKQLPEELPEDTPEPVRNLREVLSTLSPRNLQECYNDAIYYRDEVRQLFATGSVNLRQRCLAERFFWNIFMKLAEEKEKLKTVPRDLQDIDSHLADIYYGNFSIFQSLPDSWAIDQLFPVMPVTCDSDGQIDHFIDQQGIKRTLELHELRDGEEYYLGIFLVGAYQETLGDLHNLMGDNNVVSVRIEDDGSYEVVREQQGDTVADVLSYVEYEPRRIMEDLRSMAERAVREGRITPSQRFSFLQTFEDGLRGYTYFES